MHRDKFISLQENFIVQKIKRKRTHTQDLATTIKMTLRKVLSISLEFLEKHIINFCRTWKEELVPLIPAC